MSRRHSSHHPVTPKSILKNPLPLPQVQHQQIQQHHTIQQPQHHQPQPQPQLVPQQTGVPLAQAAPVARPPLDKTDDNNPYLPKRPYPNSYWATPVLLGSEYPGSWNGPAETVPRLEKLLNVGILDFIDLTESTERLPAGQPYLPYLDQVARQRGMEVVQMGGPGAAERIARAERKRERHLSTGSQGALKLTRTRSRSGSRSPLPEVGHRRSTSFSQPILNEWQIQPSSKTIRYGHFPIRDTTVPDKVTLQNIVTALYFSQIQGRRAVLHCNGGYGRTGTVIGAWLVTGGYVKDTIETVPNMYWPMKNTKTGQMSYLPYQRQKSAGENALELLAKKWKGVEKSWYVATTPGNTAQMEFVKAIRPPKNMSGGAQQQQQAQQHRRTAS